MSAVGDAAAPEPGDRGQSLAHIGLWLSFLAIALLVLIQTPLFLRTPLATDVVLYDIEAENLRNGGVAYRDLFETNLPGIVWIHTAVRGALGPSWEAIRAFDLAVMGAIIALLFAWIRPQTGSATAAVAALFMTAFYYSTTEWCHAQRDAWMLLPALAALWARQRSCALAVAEPGSGGVFRRSIIEGVLWGCAFWIKPMVAVPALACWLATALMTRRPARSLLDAAGLLVGGGAIGAAGVAWLVGSGAWPVFIETLTEWNPQYVAARTDGWTLQRWVGTIARFFPWSLLHFVAVPVALAQCWVGFTGESGATRRRTLLAVCYLAWFAQTILLQHLFDYVHVPALLLAIAVLASADWRSHRGWRLAAAGFAALALTFTPLMALERLATWSSCVRGPASPKLHDQLARLKQVEWANLRLVSDYLRTARLRDGELTCVNSTLVYLYDELHLRPSTRYAYLDCTLVFCGKFAPRVLAELAASPTRLTVIDVPETAGVGAIEPALPSVNEVLFRAGRYVVARSKPPAAVSAVGAVERSGL